MKAQALLPKLTLTLEASPVWFGALMSTPRRQL